MNMAKLKKGRLGYTNKYEENNVAKFHELYTPKRGKFFQGGYYDFDTMLKNYKVLRLGNNKEK